MASVHPTWPFLVRSRWHHFFVLVLYPVYFFCFLSPPPLHKTRLTLLLFSLYRTFPKFWGRSGAHP